MKNKRCVMLLIISAALLVSGFIFGEDMVKLPSKISPKAAKLQSDPFYRRAGGLDYSRLALVKPYELFSCDKYLEDPGLMDNTGKGSSLIGRQICGVKKFNVFKKYLIMYVEPGVGQSGTLENVKLAGDRFCYLILDLNKKGYSDFRISRDYAFGRINYLNEKIIRNIKPPYVIVTSYGKNKTTEKFKTKKKFLDKAKYLGFCIDYIKNNYNKIEISMPQEFQDCVFFSEKELKAGLKARAIPENIKFFEPKYFYKKFINKGQCPWFPK